LKEPSLAAFVVTRRHATGLSQRALADQAGITAPALAAVESGHSRRPRPALVRQLAEIFAVSPVELLALSGQLDDSPLWDVAERLAIGVWACASRADQARWLSVALGAYLTACRQATGDTVGQVARRFAERWSVPCTPEQWARVEGGEAPGGLDPASPPTPLRLLPGHWLWAIGTAVGVDHALLFAMVGRLPDRVAAAIGSEMPRWVRTAWPVAARVQPPYVDVTVLLSEVRQLREREVQARVGVRRASDGTWHVALPGDLPAEAVHNAYDQLMKWRSERGD
jgi:transcriptional regulator with XRE-family HTH domain